MYVNRNRNNSANYGSLLQIERLMSERCLEGQRIYQFLPFQGDEVGGSIERCLLTLNFDAKSSQSEAELAFELPYFSPRQAVIKIIVQGANTDK